MAKFEEHCAESVRLFGKPYAELYRWLDELLNTTACVTAASATIKPESMKLSGSLELTPIPPPANISSPTLSWKVGPNVIRSPRAKAIMSEWGFFNER